MQEILIGYDARDISVDFAWDTAHRQLFLIKEDVDKTLSIDTKIWKSIFDTLDIQCPEKMGYRGKLWADLEAMETLLKTQTNHEEIRYIKIAASQFLSDEAIRESGLTVLPFHPASISKDWILLGYDIAEETLLSGLMSMAYKADEKLYAKQEFLAHINSYHLFDNYEIAQKFAQWNASRDKGHGPWYVTGIYAINHPITNN